MFDSDTATGLLEPGDMARAKAGKQAKGPGKSRPKQRVILAYKADEKTADAFKEWLDALSRHATAPVTVVIDQALSEYAKSRGFPTPMPKRLVK
jgi:hypothetical protein